MEKKLYIYYFTDDYIVASREPRPNRMEPGDIVYMLISTGNVIFSFFDFTTSKELAGGEVTFRRKDYKVDTLNIERQKNKILDAMLSCTKNIFDEEQRIKTSIVWEN